MSIADFPVDPVTQTARESRSSAVVKSAAAVPTVKEVRSNFDEEVKDKSTLLGLAIFLSMSAVYCGLYFSFLAVGGLALKLAFAVSFGFCICAMFVIGHDACHQALTPRPWLNKLLGRIAFLPSLHSYSHWDWGHNGLHHGWTNVRGKDPVFVPLSKAEYDQLSAFGKWKQRFYRTPFGLGFYYLIEMWGAYAGWPMLGKRAKTKKSQQAIDWCLAMGFVFVQAFVILRFGRADTLGIGSHFWAQVTMLGLGIVLPFAIWNAAMGFVIFQHHTHPEVPWFADVKEWTFFGGQVESVIHVELPKPIELFLHNIMDHTAHHVDPKIPLYNLPHAQKNLESAYPTNIKIVEWTLRGFLNTCAVCRLYDYEGHRWLDYDGTPTSPPHRLGRVG